ncbi:MAG TPA: hypothetical protein VKV17_05800 [Bryobacteraceae bacterium]|nr:hypothetical protein [Bryobacteraceae bacterium]
MQVYVFGDGYADQLSDMRCADDRAGMIAERRPTDTRFDHHFEVVDVFACGDLLQDFAFLIQTVRWQQEGHMLTPGFGCGISVNPFRRGISSQDIAIQRLADDRVVGRLNDCR